MPVRFVAFVAGLTLGDYLLWNWSLAGNHDVVALVAGLSMPALVIALVWMLVVSAARLFGQATSRAPSVVGQRAVRGRLLTSRRARRRPVHDDTSARVPATASADRPARRLAA